MIARIQLRNDLASSWISVNPVLAQGEIGIESDTLKQKIGDGSSDWITLGYSAQPTTDADLQTLEKTITGAINEVNSDLTDHATNILNPHSVTKTQVGLGNVDNTSDLTKAKVNTYADLNTTDKTIVGAINETIVTDSAVNGNIKIAGVESTVYTHPNHSGDIVSTGDGATVISENVVSNSKLTQMPTKTFKGNKESITGNTQDLTIADAQTMIFSDNEHLPVSLAEKTQWNNTYSPVKIYNTVAEMQADSINLSVDKVTETLGYTTKGDGNGRKYIIKATDDGTNLPCGTGLWFNKFSNECLEKGGYQGTAQDLKNDIDGKTNSDTIVKKLKILSADSVLSGYSIDLDETKDFIDRVSIGYASNTNFANLKVNLPYIVVIGDSISEGHPQSHGRLHNSSGAVDLSYESHQGQFSYDLSVLTGMPSYNHGIGGQTTVQIKNRWNRDVLGQDVPTLTPTRTIPSDYGLPYAVYYHCGINDFAQNVPIETVKDNILEAYNSCISNGIFFIIDNVGCGNDDLTQLSKVQEINSWLKTVIVDEKSVLNDYFSYFHNADGTIKTGYSPDGIHPYRKYYTSYTNTIVFENIKNKILFLNSLDLHCLKDMSDPSRQSNPFKKLIFEGLEYNVNTETTQNKIETVEIQNLRLKTDKYFQSNLYISNDSLYVFLSKLNFIMTKFKSKNRNIKSTDIQIPKNWVDLVYATNFQDYNASLEKLQYKNYDDRIVIKGLVKNLVSLTTDYTVIATGLPVITKERILNVIVRSGALQADGLNIFGSVLSYTTDGKITFSQDGRDILANGWINLETIIYK